MKKNTIHQGLLSLVLVSSLGACTTLSPNGTEQTVREQAAKLLGQSTATKINSRAEQRDELLAQTLQADDTVAVALLNNPSLQKHFAQLRISETELVANTRLRNPSVSLGRSNQGSEHEVNRSIVFDVMGLLTLPLSAPVSKQHYQNAQLFAVQAVLNLARDTRLAYFDAVASQQRARYAADVKLAAEAGRDLAKDLASVGNISRLDAAREQAFYAEAMANQVRAQSQQNVALERLARLLGLTQTQSIKLPDTLPELPSEPRVLNQIEQLAMTQRIDVQMAKRDVENTAKSLKLSKVTRFVNVLELGYQHNTFSDAPKQTGVEVSFELPLFDFGTTRVAQAQAIYQGAVAQATETAINAQSEARSAYLHYRTAYDLAKHYRDEVVPLQKQISDEVLLRYNGMLISTFELLEQSRAQIESVQNYLDALHDFWVAEAELNSTLQGTGASMSSRGRNNE